MIKDLCFEIIDRCPNECRFCSSNSCYSNDIKVEFASFKRVIDYFMNRYGIEEISLSGGEPFLHPDLYEMIKYSKSLGIRTVVFTSGVKQGLPVSDEYVQFYTKKMNDSLKEIEENEPWNDRLKSNIRAYYNNYINPLKFSQITSSELMELKNIGLDKIVFDYQAYEYDTDAYLMGRKEYMHTCLLDSLFNASSVGFDVDVHFIPMRPNYQQIGDILEMLEIAKINKISILKFVPQGRGCKNVDQLMLSDDELNEFMSLLDKHKKNFSGNIRVGIPLLNKNSHMCNAGYEKLDIKYDGTILPCPAFKELDFITMEKYGIKYYNIYDNIEEFELLKTKRLEPLCNKIYKK